jgi:hypothetical protein
VTASRLSPKRKDYIRQSQLRVEMARDADPYETGARIEGEQTWSCSLVPDGSESALVAADVHRLPLKTGHEVPWNAETGDFVPGEPVYAAVEVDELTALALKRLTDVRRADSATSLLVLDSVLCHDAWRELDLAQLAVALFLAEIAEAADATVVCKPRLLFGKFDFTWGNSTAAERRRLMSDLGFVPLKAGSWILADWQTLRRQHDRQRRRFGFYRSPQFTHYEPSFIVAHRREARQRIHTPERLCELYGRSANLDEVARLLNQAGLYDTRITLALVTDTGSPSSPELIITSTAERKSASTRVRFPFTTDHFHKEVSAVARAGARSP